MLHLSRQLVCRFLVVIFLTTPKNFLSANIHKSGNLQEMEDKKMRSYAVIPPILLDEKTRRKRFNNKNGLIEDPMQEYKDKQLLNIWTDQEKEIFKVPKRFYK